MPTQTVEQLDARLERAKKKLAELGEGADPVRRRSARKAVKRLQRKRRTFAREAARRGGGKTDAPAE